MTQTNLFTPSAPASAKVRAKPFLKWAGGKTQLLPELTALLPRALTDPSQAFGGRYFEPFMGSAALFFHLAPNLAPGRAFLGDMNEELVLTFLAVRDHPDALLESLAEYDRKHNGPKYDGPKHDGARDGAPDFGAQSALYYAVRSLDREPEWRADAYRDPERLVAHAARFIYLNRTCFNGLWRVNRKGHHNVPMGRYQNPGIYNPKLLEQAHAALQGVDVQHRSFEATAAAAGAGDVVYFDPPYMPLSATSSFNAYAKDAFLVPAHQKLAVVALVLAARGVRVVLSNSDTPFTRAPLGEAADAATFAKLVTPLLETLGPSYAGVPIRELLELYRGHWQVQTVYAGRAINAKGDRRGSVSEILVYA